MVTVWRLVQQLSLTCRVVTPPLRSLGKVQRLVLAELTRRAPLLPGKDVLAVAVAEGQAVSPGRLADVTRPSEDVVLPARRVPLAVMPRRCRVRGR